MNIDTNPEQPPDPTIERSTRRRWTWLCTLIGNRENVVAGFSWDQKYTLSNELRNKNQGTVTQIIRANAKCDKASNLAELRGQRFCAKRAQRVHHQTRQATGYPNH